MTIHTTLPNKRDKGQVEVLSGMGATEDFIASHLNLTIEQLREHYSKELRNGQEEANLQVAKAFHEMAVSGEFPQMTIAWMKMRAGWTDAISTDTRDDEEELAALETSKAKLIQLLNRGT